MVHIVTLSNGKKLRIVEEEYSIGINSADEDGDHEYYLATLHPDGEVSTHAPYGSHGVGFREAVRELCQK